MRKELNADYFTEKETTAVMSLLTEKALDEIYLEVVSSAEFNDEILNKYSFSFNQSVKLEYPFCIVHKPFRTNHSPDCL